MNGFSAVSRRSQQRTSLTIVTPVFNESAGLPAYREAVDRTLFSRSDLDVSILFVDDGSTDASWQLIEQFARDDRRMSGLRLSRNFGAHAALAAGIERAGGAAVATLACDLQDPPETILEFVEQWRTGADIVWGIRRSRGEAAWRIMASGLFFRLIRRYAMPPDSQFTTGSFLLMDRRVVECYRQFNEHSRVTFALVAWTGFDQARVSYDRTSRKTGASGWSFLRMMRTMYDTFIAFSDLPARLITFLGLGVWFTTLLFSVYLIISWLAHAVLPGWTGIMLALMVFFGLLFLILGVFGQYLHRIYAESTRRPIYFVAKETPPGRDGP